jgi:phosphate transport system substrate-binding protein
MVTGISGAQPLDGTIRPVVEAEISPYVPATGVSGALVVAGSDTMQPLLTKLASEFSRHYAEAKIAVEGGGSAETIREFIIGYSKQRRGDKAREFGHTSAGDVSILASSRPLTPEERARFQSRYGYEVMEVPIAEDAVAIYVHKTNPVRQLTLEQVDAVFSTTRKAGGAQDIRTWGQLGLEGDWNQHPIHLYGRDKRSGTREFLIQSALNGGELKPDIQEAPGSASEILAIAGDPLAIGYAGIGYQASSVKVVPLAARPDQSAVAPSAESIANKTYPLRRTLYLYVNQDPNRKFSDPLLQEFLRFVNSQEAQQVVAKARFYPLSKDQAEKNLAVIAGPMRTTSLLLSH